MMNIRAAEPLLIQDCVINAKYIQYQTSDSKAEKAFTVPIESAKDLVLDSLAHLHQRLLLVGCERRLSETVMLLTQELFADDGHGLYHFLKSRATVEREQDMLGWIMLPF